MPKTQMHYRGHPVISPGRFPINEFSLPNCGPAKARYGSKFEKAANLRWIQ